MDKDKEIRQDAKLKNLPPEALEKLWSMRNPEAGGEKLTFARILEMLPELFGITSSLGAISEFYSWLRLKRRIDRAAERATQVRLELAKDGDLNPEDLERAAQCVFTAETMEAGDVKGYVALATLRLNKQRVDQDERKLRILEAKAAQADAAKEVLGTTLSAEEQNRRLREILK